MIRRVTFEVDQGKLFDMLAVTGDWSAIGQRVVGALLSSNTSALEAISMAVYGIVPISPQPDAHPHREQGQDMGGDDGR